MKKYRYLFSLVLLWAVAMPMFSQVVSSNNEDEVYKVDSRFAKNDFVPGQVLVKFKDEHRVGISRAKGKFLAADRNAINAVLQKYGTEEMEQLLPREKAGRTLRKAKAYNGTVVAEKDLSQLYCVKLSAEHQQETMQLVDELKALDEVEFAEPNYRVYTLADETICPDYSGNPLNTNQWYLDAYGVKELWTKPIINSERPVIAILDTGVDITHPDLVDNIWTNTLEAEGEEGYDNDNNGFKNDIHGWDFINQTGNIRDNNMHGTHVAGIAAAANNGIGIVGANPLAYIMPITVMQSDGTGDIATIVKGIDYAVANGATVLNLSLGTYSNSLALRQALEKAYQTAVIVAAAGNDGKCVYISHFPSYHQFPIPAPMFPAAYSFVLGVQAISQNGSLAGFSNYDDNGPNFSSESTLQDPDGFNYELKAPGVGILSTIPNGNYRELNGTSMAAPLVAGAISALKMVKEYDTQEILWGDLTHTDNISQAFNLGDHPAELDITRLMLHERKELTDETEEDYSEDGEIDAGETVSIYPVIRTTWGEANNIKLRLELDDEFEDPNTVEIIIPEADFGMHLDAYGKGVSVNPLQLKVSDNVADNRHIKMKMVATCDGTDTEWEHDFVLVVNNMVKISGLISEDRTLTADHVYLVNDNLGIMKGVTLTIEPGTRLEFAENVGLSSFGKLVAKGTPKKPIVFTGHNGAIWRLVASHKSEDVIEAHVDKYTNSDTTLFTLKPTSDTPFSISFIDGPSYYTKPGYPSKTFKLEDYMTWREDMSAYQDLLTDPQYLTPAVNRMMADMKDYVSQFPSTPTDQETLKQQVRLDIRNWWRIYSNPRDSISYCRIENSNSHGLLYPFLKDCIIIPWYKDYNAFHTLEGIRVNVMGLKDRVNAGNDINTNLLNSNIINNVFGDNTVLADYLPSFSQLANNNYFNNFATTSPRGDKYKDRMYALANVITSPNIDKSDNPSYLGTSREEIIRPFVYEMGNAPDTYGTVDLSNMLLEPVPEAHGIVWKVVVNGYDAQDEFEQLPPLGVGKHKFEVYFNRPMNKEKAPQISFGVRDPWTQNAVAEDGSWNEEGTIYTAYKTITGKTKSDGLNRIYVYGAEDNEFFDIPYEKTRFNINIQAAGSMATGFAAEAGLGKVELTWNNENNDIEDAMGYNLYRYTLKGEGEEMVADTIRVNENIIDIEEETYTDYDVTPGETYYYFYRTLSTDLQEYDVSNVVAVTPLTSTKGDANGSGDVDVADVITTVNYAAGQQPKPFIYEAADMNDDLSIDILDVIGIIKTIMNPGAEAKASVAAVATYTIEDGVVYVDSPVEIAGVQVQLSLSEKLKENNEKMISVAEDMKGFEHTSAWLSDNDYLFLGYNMNGKTLAAGKHAILIIGDAQIADIRLSDRNGHNIIAESTTVDKIDRMARDVMTINGIYDLQGRKISGNVSDLQKLPKGVYIVNGVKVVR